MLYAKKLPFIVTFNPHDNPRRALLLFIQWMMGKLRLREVKDLSQGPLSSLDTV